MSNFSVIIDEAVAEARSLPDLINRLEQLDPALALQLTGKALIYAKTPWGALASGIIGFLVAHYSLGFDPATTNFVAGLSVLVGSYIMRYITSVPITGILESPPKPSGVAASLELPRK
jgi:hypothetical protein